MTLGPFPTFTRPHGRSGRPLAVALLLVAALALVAMGCSPRQMMVAEFGALVSTGMDRLEATGDVDLVEAGLPGQITLLEAMLANAPDDRRLGLLLARLYAAQGLLFLEPQAEAAAWNLPLPWRDAATPPPDGGNKNLLARGFLRGAGHALAVVAQQRPDSAARLANVREIGPYLEAVGGAEVPALFWYALNLGAWVNHHPDDLTALAQAHVAERIMRRVIELQPDYYHGFAHLFLLVYYGSRPPMLGGNLDAARRHYLALKQVPGASTKLADVTYARHCLPLRQQRDRYVALLTPIAATPVSVDTTLLDAAAIRRAQLYLLAEERFFE